jgi:CheY-like chemotaxis protein
MKSKPINILLAEDDQDDCAFFDQALKELSLDTTLKIVSDGEQLMQLLKDESMEIPDVLFLDINMPRKSGTECLEEIKKIDRLKNLPVVMLSTSNDPQKITFHFKIGANVYIHKPNDFSQLKQVIHHALPISTEELGGKSKIKYILNA